MICMKTEIKCVIFDLDGTLVNTITDLGLACDYLLEKKGIKPVWSENDYKQFVGNGAKLLVERAFDGTLNSKELEEQYALFKIKYNEIKMDHAHIYKGMYETVEKIKNLGIKTAVCTNKPHTAAKGMVETLFGKDFFDVIVGAADDMPKKPDPAMANKILEKISVLPAECVWIGDSSVDMESAVHLGCKSIAVTWGFRSRESLQKYHPALVADSPEDILKFFSN